MVRFARAEGSKGSNKRVLEEPTPWSELVAQDINKVETRGKEESPKKKKKKKVLTDEKNVNFPEILLENGGKIKQQMEECLTTVNKLKEQSEEECGVQEPPSKTEGEKKKKKKKKKKDENLSAVAESEFIVNSKGQRLKVFRDGTERTWFDLPYEENERMTRYSNMWVKREMVEKLDQLKASLQDAGLGEKEAMRKMMKAKRKAHKDLRIELIYEQKRLVSGQTDVEGKNVAKNSIKASKKEKRTKKEEEKSYHVKTKTEEIFEQKDNDSSNEGKEDCDFKEQHTFCDNQENVGVQLRDVSVGKSTDEKYKTKRNDKVRPEENFEALRGGSQSEKKTFSSDFEENDMMTQYDGFWVKREAVERLNAVKAEKQQCIYAARADENRGKELTRGEQITLQRVMKKEKRFEHRQLTKELARLRLKRKGMWPGVPITMRARENNYSSVKSYDSSKSDDCEVVRFDGYWVKKESADRLNRLKERLTSEGVSEEELQKILQKERRTEERVLKNERKLVCLKCRKPGHMVSACPELTGAGEGQITICYTCGSTEHISRDCSLKRKGAEFSHATCFICGEVGHISRECPDNPRGLYPNGGACRGCGSVEHFVKDCPDMQKEYEESNIKVNRIDRTAVEALDIDEPADASPNAELLPVKKRQVKVVKF